MTIAWIVGLALLGQEKAGPEQFPLALHRSMEIDDYDREIRFQHDTVLIKKAHLAGSQRLAQKGAVSRQELEEETASVRYQEAKEQEMIAYRAIKVYERDVLSRAAPANQSLGYTLLLELLKKQEAMAQVDLDFRTVRLRQEDALLQRHVISRQERDDAELAYETALANVALSQARQAQVAMELAARNGEKTRDQSEVLRLKTAYVQARIHYYEIKAEAAKSRLTMARERSRLGLIPSNEVELFQKAYEDATADVATERKQLDDIQSPLPARFSRFG